MSEHDPVLQVDEPTGSTRAVALVLPGGQSRSHGPVRPTQLAVLRMRPFVTHLLHGGAAHGLAVARLRYRVRGWNGAEQSPVPDTCWALDQLAERFPQRPVALLGHSLGARAAIYAAGHPAVRAVVGLAPWIESADPYAQLLRRRLLLIHGDHDHMTSAAQSARFAQESLTTAESVGYVCVHRDGHPMLRRPGIWHELATGYTLAVMCEQPPGRTVSADSAKVLEKALAGDTSLRV